VSIGPDSLMRPPRRRGQGTPSRLYSTRGPAEPQRPQGQSEPHAQSGPQPHVAGCDWAVGPLLSFAVPQPQVLAERAAESFVFDMAIS
jgi:hypothetical protein